MATEIPVYICAGKCGKEVAIDQIDSVGWQRLEVVGRYRCGECTRALAKMGTAPGAPCEDGVDPLNPHDIGALKKLPERPPLHEKPGGNSALEW